MIQIKKKLDSGWRIRVLIWIIVVCSFLPYFGAARYAIFMADDFSYYNERMESAGSTYIMKGINYMITSYKNWQGTWGHYLFHAIVDPMGSYSYGLLRLILCVMLVFTLLGVCFLAVSAAKYFGFKEKNTIYLIGLFLIPLLSYKEYKEVYLWYVGATVNLLPIIFFTIGFALMLLGKVRGKSVYYVLSAVFLFLMTGEGLEVVGFGMSCLLLFIVVEYVRTRKLNISFLIIFGTALLGALLNAAAPGNFARRGRIGGEMSIVHSLYLSVKVLLQEEEWLYKNTSFIVFMVLAFCLGCCINKRLKDITFAVFITGLVLIPVITIFPVALGYGDIQIATLPDRCMFLFDASIIICNIGIAILVGNKLFTKSLLPDINNIKFVVGLVALVMVFMQGSLSDYMPLKIAVNLKKGIIQDYADTWVNIYEQIRESDKEEVIITGAPKEAAGCIYPNLLDDVAWWVNRNVAEYFQKESVCVIREDEE